MAPDRSLRDRYYYEWAPPDRNNDNELCLWRDGKNKNVFMLFYFSSPDADPKDLVKSGMSGSNSRTVVVADVGSGAVAGFGKATGGAGAEVMGLFAARSETGTIGIRVQGITSEKSEKFRVLKEIASRA